MNEVEEQVFLEDEVIIYGARLVALECARWLIKNGHQSKIKGFAVTDMAGNKKELIGLSVKRIEEYENKDSLVIIAMPEKYHNEVEEYAKSKGFSKFLRIGLEKMAKIKSGYLLSDQSIFFDVSFLLYEDVNDNSWLNMTERKFIDKKNNDNVLNIQHYKFPTLFYLDEQSILNETRDLDFQQSYKKVCGKYRNLHTLSVRNFEKNNREALNKIMHVYMAFSNWDSAKVEFNEYNPWIYPLHLGKKLSPENCFGLSDDMGENISDYNSIFAEMTGAYWIWKNANNVMYKGLCHYRRHFIISEEQIITLDDNGIDVILTTPRYVPGGVKNMFIEETPVNDEVYERLICAIGEVYPKEKNKFEKYMDSCYYYPNNMVIARSYIYDDYCNWVFPILFKIFEKDNEVGYEYMRDRHIAYAAELLTSYYFVKNKDNYCIAVTDYKFYS